MANPDHLAILEQGVDAWNRWRDEHPEERADLNGADLLGEYLPGANLYWANLSDADLREADLSRANLGEADLSRANLHEANLGSAGLIEADIHHADLTGANLGRAKLSGADFHGANLSSADLRLAHLSGAKLSRANLDGANLSSTDLTGANLGEANLKGTDFTGTSIGWTAFSNIDLSTAIGLETVIHTGPSSIGIDTIYRSQGKIPDVFLRGCGVPENFIHYVGSLVGQPIEFYSCFISYSTKDQEFADRLYADMQAKGIRCWFAPHDIQAGKKVHEQIDEAIRLHEKLLLILSPASMQSEWVKTEIAKARKREVKEQKRLLFPVRLVEFEALQDWECFDGDTGKDSAREIREYHIPDFSQWKEHDLYQKAFDMLLRDLKAEAASRTR